MKYLIGLVGGVFLLLLITNGTGHSQPSTDKAFKKVMEQKLKSSKKLLEGLALSDFAKMQTNAKRLVDLTNTEEWLAIKTPEYAIHTNEFRDALNKMLKNAKAKNLDGAAFAYVEMTLTCVRCHQYVRKVRDVRWEGSE